MPFYHVVLIMPTVLSTIPPKIPGTLNALITHGTVKLIDGILSSVFGNNVCQYTFNGRIGQFGIDSPYDFASDLTTAEIESLGNVCLDLVRIPTYAKYGSGSAEGVSRSEISTRVKCPSFTGIQGLSYSFIGTNGNPTHPYEHIKAAMRASRGTGVLKRVWRKIAGDAPKEDDRRVQETAENLCGFIRSELYHRFIGVVSHHAVGDMLVKLQASSEPFAAERMNTLSYQWGLYLSDVFVRPSSDDATSSESARATGITVTSHQGTIDMHTELCGVKLDGIWLIPAQIDLLRASVKNVCLSIPMDNREKMAQRWTGSAPYIEIRGEDQSPDISLACPVKTSTHRVSWMAGTENPFAGLCSGPSSKDNEEYKECVATYTLKLSRALCAKLEQLVIYASILTGSRTPQEFGIGRMDRYLPRLRERVEFAGPVIGAVLVGKRITSTHSSSVFNVEGRDDLVIKYLSDCNDYPLVSDSNDGRMAAAVGVGPIVYFISPPTPLAGYCGRTTTHTPVCGAPGTDGYAKLQFGMFETSHSIQVSARNAGVKCKAEGNVRYMIMERVESCSPGGYQEGRMSNEGAIQYGIDVIKLIRNLHEEAGILHGEVRPRKVCKRISTPHDLVLIGSRLAGRVSEETDIPLRDSLTQVHPDLTPWELEGFKSARRDDIYNTLYMVAFLLSGEVKFSEVITNFKDDPQALLKWKSEGPLFGSNHSHPFRPSLSQPQVYEIQKTLDEIHRHVMTLGVGEAAKIDYEFVIDQFKLVQTLLALNPTSARTDA